MSRSRVSPFRWVPAVVGAACATAALALGAGCGGGGACEKGVEALEPLRPDTIRDAPRDQVEPWKKQLDAARAACAAEDRAGKLERIADVDHAITMRWADITLEAGRAVESAAASASAPPALPTSWTTTCADVVRDGGFVGLLPTGIPREAASRLVTTGGAGTTRSAPPGLAAKRSAPPDEALVLGGRPVYLAARGGKLEGSILQDGAFVVQQSLPWPEEAAAEGVTVDQIVAARGPEVLGIAWIANLNVYFAALDVGTERWTAFGELPVSGDDGGRDLILGDMAWGRASFGLVLGTARGFAFVEVLPTARAIRPAALQPAFVAGRPRIAWDGERFSVAAGRADGAPSMGIWRAPDGANAATWLPLLESVPSGVTFEPLDGELVSAGGALHLGFRVVTGAGPRVHLGHALAGGPAALETCP